MHKMILTILLVGLAIPVCAFHKVEKTVTPGYVTTEQTPVYRLTKDREIIKTLPAGTEIPIPDFSKHGVQICLTRIPYQFNWTAHGLMDSFPIIWRS